MNVDKKRLKFEEQKMNRDSANGAKYSVVNFFANTHQWLKKLRAMGVHRLCWFHGQ
jgi:hypothetical protein